MTSTSIEWCAVPGYKPRSWNPTGWGCTCGCGYCYAHTFAVRFGNQFCLQLPTAEQIAMHGLDPLKSMCANFFPHLHAERLDEPIRAKKPCAIFAGSMADFWDPNVPQEWRDLIWETCRQTPQHRYFVLTKQPQNITDELRVGFPNCIPENVIAGFSCDGQESYDDRMGWWEDGRTLIVSIEPLLLPVSELSLLGADDWVIVGAQSGPGAFVPPSEWVERIVEQGRQRQCAVFVKNSLRAMYPERDWPQEWLEGSVL